MAKNDLQMHGQKLLSEALVQFWEAMLELTRPTSPQTPLPRPPAKPEPQRQGAGVGVCCTCRVTEG